VDVDTFPFPPPVWRSGGAFAHEPKDLPWASCSHTCLCHQAVYLVPADGQWCSLAGKVTGGLVENNGSLASSPLRADCLYTGISSSPTLGNEYGQISYSSSHPFSLLQIVQSWRGLFPRVPSFGCTYMWRLCLYVLTCMHVKVVMLSDVSSVTNVRKMLVVFITFCKLFCTAYSTSLVYLVYMLPLLVRQTSLIAL